MSPESILAGLAGIANRWSAVAVAWHVYFGLGALALLAGLRPSRRFAALAMVLPLVSVAVLAALARNPFNSGLFALGGIVLAVIAVRTGPQSVVPAAGWRLVTGFFLLVFGWVYPHFLEGEPWLVYLYRAPLGLVPCPTLSAVIGATLVLGNFGSRAWPLALAALGLFYGVFGAAVLGVTIDWLLAAGALALAISGFRPAGAR